MKIFKLKVLFVLTLAVCISSMAVFAGGQNRTGTNAAPELLIPVGARDIAMGGASIATSYGIDAIYWNPAGLSRSQYSATAMFSHMNYIADINVNYFAMGANFSGLGTIGFSLKSLDFGNIAVTNEDYPDGTGQLISPTYVTLGATYSKLLTDNISVGATANLISERIDRVSATGFAFNAGVQYSGLGSIDGLCLGVAVKNIGPQMQFDGSGLLHQGVVGEGRQGYYKVEAAAFELPSTIEIGVSYLSKLSEDNNLTFTSLFQNNNFSADEYKVGAEYGYRNNFFVRGGWNFAEQSKDNSVPTYTDQSDYLYGFTGGVGVQYDLGDVNVGVDYAYRSVKFLDGNHIVSLRLGF